MERRKKNIFDFLGMKKVGEKIAYLVTYDWHNAKYAEQSGMDMLLTGDSVGMSIYGYSGTIPVTMDQMLVHTEAVRRGAPNTFLIGDMPFGSYQTGWKDAVRSTIRFHKEAYADAVKLEGGRKVTREIMAITDAGMNVMGHIGLTPQSSGRLGGFKAQGRTFEAAEELLADAREVERAGAFAILVEAVPAEVTKAIAERVKITILSIGAGPYCDGQLLLDIDLLGRGKVFTPKFVKDYAKQAVKKIIRENQIHFRDNEFNLAEITLKSFEEYVKEVKSGVFPDPEKHCYKMANDEELARLKEAYSL